MLIHFVIGGWIFMLAQALAEIAKNITIKLTAEGAHATFAIIGGSTIVGLTAGYGMHEYYKHKTRLAELDYQKIMFELEHSKLQRRPDNDNNGNDNNPTTIVA